MKKKPDRKLLVAVLALMAGAAAAQGLEARKLVKEPLAGAATAWLQPLSH